MILDIIVKSFNRPYYLERCLQSIYKYVDGEFNITILDDGTPHRYLDRIAARYPEARIVKSDLYEDKVSALKDHIDNIASFRSFTIPVDLWKNQVAQCSPVFLLLEDDIWLTEHINLSSMLPLIERHKLRVVKIGWSGNERVNQGDKYPISGELEGITPALPCNSKLWYKSIALNRFKLRAVLYRLGLITDTYDLPYYTMYTVAAAFFSRDYWLYLWKDAQQKVNENQQLVNALDWKNRYPADKFGRTMKEFSKTSYLSSATNNFKDISFDMIVFNHVMNEAWYNGKLDPMENFPLDFNVSYLNSFLAAAADERCTVTGWGQWTVKFKSQYIKMGCHVE